MHTVSSYIHAIYPFHIAVHRGISSYSIDCNSCDQFIGTIGLVNVIGLMRDNELYLYVLLMRDEVACASCDQMMSLPKVYTSLEHAHTSAKNIITEINAIETLENLELADFMMSFLSIFPKTLCIKKTMHL
ncbi:MAG: hypothetical protein LRY41_01955 [Candidatus Pacebacteria bacterium]|nr:hypothetical protein [Candidatus Paceibacterota bacterium]MCD8528072.1 hypothetical protein [Candidatus Paceibacterota bacterium]